MLKIVLHSILSMMQNMNLYKDAGNETERVQIVYADHRGASDAPLYPHSS